MILEEYLYKNNCMLLLMWMNVNINIVKLIQAPVAVGLIYNIIL